MHAIHGPQAGPLQAALTVKATPVTPSPSVPRRTTWMPRSCCWGASAN